MTSFEKKQALIERDPITRRLDDHIDEYNKTNDRKIKDHTLYLIDECTSDILEKWGVQIVTEWKEDKICNWCFIGYGEEYPSKLDGHQLVIDARKINRMGNKPSVTGRVRFDPHQLPILIDLSTLTSNDAAKVKQAVWEITEKALKEFHSEKKKGWQPSPPPDEPEELGFLYHGKDETFDDYLRRYDLKMELGLSFRLIAMIEKGTTPEKQVETTKRILELEKKPKIGTPVQGESTVRNGFNLIYKAIHRTDSPAKEKNIQTQGKYNCPEHEQECPLNCAYLKVWVGKVYKDTPLIGKHTDPNELDKKNSYSLSERK